MTETKRVLACGWYGAGNVGDELLLSSLVRWCRELSGEVTALSIDPAYTRAHHGIDAVDLYDMVAVARVMQGSDLFVLGGGGLFQTYHSMSVPALYDFEAYDIAAYARPVLMARQMSVPVLPWAQGVGPLDGIDARKIVREVFSAADFASVRDTSSLELLTRLGVQSETAVAPDPVWALELDGHARRLGGKVKRLGIVVRSWGHAAGWEDRLCATLQSVDSSEITFVWIPFQTHSVVGRSASELDFISAMMERVQAATGAGQELASPASQQEAIDFLSGCDALIAMRLHAQILGQKLQLPTFCLFYDAKMKLAAQQADMDADSGIDLNNASVSEWGRNYVSWWKGGTPQASVGSKTVRRLGIEALEHRDMLRKALASSDEPRHRRVGIAFDWLGAWQQKSFDAALQTRDAALSRLNALVMDAHATAAQSLSASAQLAQSLAEQQTERRSMLEELDSARSAASNAVADSVRRADELSLLLQQRDAQLVKVKDELTDRDLQLSSAAHQLSAIREKCERTLTDLEAQRQVAHDLSLRLVAQESEHSFAIKHVETLLSQRLAEIQSGNDQINRAQWLVTQAEQRCSEKQREIDELRASTSWKITRPMRFVKYFLRSPGFAVSRAVRTLSGHRRGRLLPQSGDGHPAALITRPAREPGSAASGDLTWIEFNRQVLQKRDKYRGVFVQEIVIDWNVPLYQRPQHMAIALARLGYLVIYKTVNWTGDDVEGFRQVAENVWLSNRPEVDKIEGVVRSVYSTAYADDPVNLQKRPPGSVMIYEYIDHIDPQISGDAENIKRLTKLRDWAFGGGADFIVASARQLESEACAAVGRSRVLLVQNGVDTRHYRDSRHTSYTLPETFLEFRSRYSTVVGYFGAIAPWLWYEEMEKLVLARQDLGFVFIGPDYYGGASRLPNGDNTLYLGPVDYRVLPAYARQFDVCFIPFEPGDIARTTSPLKLFEYFALERPVVVTSEMTECVAHPEVFSGRDAEELSSAIDKAISVKSDPVFSARLAQLADENDWDCRARTLETVFASVATHAH